jgi:D-lactate dehydrogenase (cytochrome)
MRIIEMGGTCTGEHGIGSGKIDALVAETGPAAVGVMKSIKLTLDPNNILNPGKVFH